MFRRSFLAGLAGLSLGACADITKPMSAADREWWDRSDRRAEVRRLARELERERRRDRERRRRWRR